MDADHIAQYLGYAVMLSSMLDAAYRFLASFFADSDVLPERYERAVLSTLDWVRRLIQVVVGGLSVLRNKR